MPIKLGLIEMVIIMGLIGVASLMYTLHDSGRNQNQTNGIP